MGFGAVNFMNDKAIQNEDDNGDVPMVGILTAHPSKFPNIIRGFFDDKKRNKERELLFKNELNHRFLPKIGDKEECIELKSDQSPNTKDNWAFRWTQTLRNDVIKANKDNASY